MMSNTSKIAPVAVSSNPSSTAYNVDKYNTIGKPMATGGSPNNPFTMIKFENHIR